jgi:hypothetical protein
MGWRRRGGGAVATDPLSALQIALRRRGFIERARTRRPRLRQNLGALGMAPRPASTAPRLSRIT